MQYERKMVHACPECGGGVLRVHRHIGDRLVALFLKLYRYRCESPECGWEGIVSIRSVPTCAAAAASVNWTARLTWMAIGVAVALAGVGSVKLYRNAGAAKTPIPSVEVAVAPSVPVGESFDGQELPDGDARMAENRSDLSLRRGCAWGVPGRSPYKGTVTQALDGAKLPEEVVRKVEMMVDRGVVSDRVEITRDSIRTVSGKRRFDTTLVAMGFGKNLCFGTRVNFQPGHVERADLYDATDAKGTNFAVMIPYVCGNVSVLAERAERPDGGGGGNGRTVPEPGTLASLAAALAAMGVALRFARRRAGGGRAKR